MQRGEAAETLAAVFAEMTCGGREAAPIHAPAFYVEAEDGKAEIDPLGYFYLTQQLERNRPALDEALASENADLMESGALLLNILEEPARIQVRLRNMFEVAFDGMERATQRERFERRSG